MNKCIMGNGDKKHPMSAKHAQHKHREGHGAMVRAQSFVNVADFIHVCIIYVYGYTDLMK